MSAHTPGDWYAEDRVERHVILTKGCDYEIASVEGGAAADETGRSEENVEADANLIAAAPDLLAACEAMLAKIEAICSAGTEDGDEANTFPADQRAMWRAAIAKARGK